MESRAASTAQFGNHCRDSTAAPPLSCPGVLLLLGFPDTVNSWVEHYHTTSLTLESCGWAPSWPGQDYLPVLFASIGLVVFILHRMTFRLGEFMYFLWLLLAL